jgi:predicted ferric reductase
MGLSIPVIYTICVGAILAILLLRRVVPSPTQVCQSRLVSVALRRIVYPYLYRRFLGFAPITRLRALVLLTYISFTLFCNFNGAGTAAQRAGWLSVINFIPLYISGRLAMVTSLLELSIKDSLAVHGAAGVMVISQTAVHIILELRNMRAQLQDPVYFYGLLVRRSHFICYKLADKYQASAALGAILVTLLAQRAAFEMFKRFHASLAILMAVAVWKHPHPDRAQSSYYIIVVTAVYLLLIAGQTISVIFRNFILSRRCARAHVMPVGDAMRIKLDLTSHFDMRPGQWVFITLPAASLWSLFESHPFMVCRQDSDPETGIFSLTLLAQVQTGFTKEIKLQSTIQRPYLALIDGPYGNPPNYGEFDSVVFVASGMGVAAHMLAIQHLLSNYKRNVRTGSITLYWELEHTGRHHLNPRIHSDRLQRTKDGSGI